MTIELSQLRDCFQGIVPAVVCTHDQDGTPNISYLSHVEYVAENQLALSNQFFSKTKRNVLQTKKALLLLLHPQTLQQYELRLHYKHSETSGELFEKMALRLSIIAASEGKAHIYKLLSSDVYEVSSITPRLGMTTRPITLPAPIPWRAEFTYGEMARGYLETITALPHSASEAIDLLLRTVRFGFGIEDSYFYLGDGQLYNSQMASQELLAEHYNVVRKVANYGKAIMLSGLQLQRRYLNSILPSKERSEVRSVARQLAIPVVFQGKVYGVLLLEDGQVESWDIDLVQALRSLCSSLALQMGNTEGKNLAKDTASTGLNFHYHCESETLFLNDVVFIKNLPAKILSYVLSKNFNQQKTLFSNQEIICALQSDFPVEGKANFEARLILIKKRLESKGLPLRFVSKMRGQFELIVETGAAFSMSGYPKT